MWCAVGITFKRNRWHCVHGSLREPPFEIIVLPLSFGQAEAPAITVNHNLNMVRIIKRRGTAIIGCVIEVPFWRGELPDEFIKVTRVFFVACSTALSCEIELIPPVQFSFRWQRHPVRRLTTDQITTHGNLRFTTFGPECGNYVGSSRSPIKATDDCLLDFEHIHQCDDVEGQG